MVLVEPEIPANTGNISRTCVLTGSALHLVEPLGFSLDDRYLKRAGLDYWQDLEVKIWPDLATFAAWLESVCPASQTSDAASMQSKTAAEQAVTAALNNSQTAGVDQSVTATLKSSQTAGANQQQLILRPFYATTHGENSLADVRIAPHETSILIFGKETAGLPKPFLAEHPERCVRIPMIHHHSRSLNLSNSVAIFLYEVLRQQGYPELS